MDRKRVGLLFYAGGFAPVGGIETFTHNLLVALEQRGFATTLVCWGKRSAILNEIDAGGTRVVRQRFRWGCRFGWPDRVMLPVGLREVRQADIVFFGKMLEPAILCSLGRARTSKHAPPFVFVTPYRPAEMWQAAPPDPDVLHLFDAIVVQARVFASDLEQVGYQKDVRVIPYLPSPESPIEPFPDAKGGMKIGFLGRLSAQKNLGYLLEAFAALKARVPAEERGQYELHLFGDGAEKVYLEAKAEELGIFGSVMFHGMIPHEAVSAAIDSCHMFAFTSIAEGQCLAALEILSRGRPIVAMAVGALPEIVNNEGVGKIVRSHARLCFADALEEVAARIRDRKITVQNVRSNYDARFSHAAVAREYTNLVEQLIQRTV